MPSVAPKSSERQGAKATGTDGRVVDPSARGAGAARIAANGGNGGQGPAVAERIGGPADASVNPVISGGCGVEGQPLATSGKNAEGRTRTANLRVMNPAL